jgi:hypothetical protein
LNDPGYVLWFTIVVLSYDWRIIMALRWRSKRIRVVGIAIALSTMTFAGCFGEKYQPRTLAETQPSMIEPNETAKAPLQQIVREILDVWDKADVVCLGEDHGSANDSNLRIALIEHPDFVGKVNAIMVEFADAVHQDVLDRFALEGKDIPREELRVVWKESSGKEVWDSPMYEAFLRTVRKINLTVPRNKRVRLIAGDNSTEKNRGRFIREAISREILDKGLKGLAIYGSRHCQCRGMGFPGELSDKYPGRIWAATSLQNVDEGRRIFGLGDEPKLIPITGTDKAKIPAGKMFFLGRSNDQSTLGDIFNAIVYFGKGATANGPAR